MNDLVAYLQNAGAAAFVLLGMATAISWMRRRESSLGWLALAIVTLAAVSLIGRLPALLHFTPPLVGQISLIGFMVSGYAVLRYRGSLIPLPRRWHAAAIVAMVAASGAYIAAQAFASTQVLAVAGIAMTAGFTRLERRLVPWTRD